LAIDGGQTTPKGHRVASTIKMSPSFKVFFFYQNNGEILYHEPLFNVMGDSAPFSMRIPSNQGAGGGAKNCQQYEILRPKNNGHLFHKIFTADLPQNGS
jgi:hypothetical protein